jgi:hypothetical protein
MLSADAQFRNLSALISNKSLVYKKMRLQFAEKPPQPERAPKTPARHVESGPLVRSSYHAHEQAAATGMAAAAN